MADEKDDIRSSLAAAFDASEKKDEPAPEPEKAPEGIAEPTPIGSETEAQKAERLRDEKGRFAKSDEKAPSEPAKAAEPEKAPEPQKPAPAAPAPPQFAPEGARAPQSWRPAVREKFKDLPPEVQEEAIRIDREVRRTMQESAEAKQNYQRFREVFAPAEPMLRAQNLDPVAFSQDAVQTAMALAQGPQETKAQAIARLIAIYGVDIPTLDRVLTQAGGVVPQQMQQPYRDPRVDELYRTIEAAKAQRQQELEAQASAQLAEVENEEYFEDLRDDMADLLDLAAKRNLALSPKEAYDRAALMHPEISKVIQQREAARLVANSAESTQRARAAASSIKGSPEAPSLNGAQPDDLRSVIAAAWDAAPKSR